MSIYWYLLKAIGFRRIGEGFLAVVGAVTLGVEAVSLFFPDSVDFGGLEFLALLAVSAVIALVYRFPRSSVSTRLSSPDTAIMIKVGDLFDEQGHLVVGTNDVFDTELGEVIKPLSVQGQFLRRVYGGNQAQIDDDIAAALASREHCGQPTTNKTLGKQLRFPIGTTISLGSVARRYYLVAYATMHEDLQCSATADDIWRSLNCLWSEVRRTGQGQSLAMPIVGSDLARVGLPRAALIKMILISFVVASKERFISRELTIVVHPSDIDHVNLYDLEDDLRSIAF